MSAIDDLVAKKLQSLNDVLVPALVRDFSGGLNTSDSDLSLSTKFSKVEENMMLASDGSKQVRWGTQLVQNIADIQLRTFYLGADPVETTNSSSVVKLTHTAHGLVSGQRVVISGATTVGGIPADEINTQHVVTRVDANTFSITVVSTASSDAAGGGTAVFYDFIDTYTTSPIIEIAFLQNRRITFHESGEILASNTLGQSFVVWNSNIAGKLSGAPDGWTPSVTFVSYDIAKDGMVVCNGVDKPLLINFNNVFPVNYLQDLGTGSNTNTPVCRYVKQIGKYTVMTGDPINIGRVHISNSDTSGTWAGDASPNDGMNFDLYNAENPVTGAIRGLGEFREKMVIALDNQIVLGTLGIYDSGGDHVPDVSDVVEEHGTVAHRSIRSLGDDMFMCDQVGVPSVARAIYTDSIRPERVSQLIARDIRADVQALTVGAAEDRIWSVYNKEESQYMLFIPNNSSEAATTQYIGYVFKWDPALKLKAWSKLQGWNFRCGARAPSNRLYMCSGTKIYLYGSEEDPVYTDFSGDTEPWSDGTYFSDNTGLSPGAEDAPGQPITFDWELPWADFGLRLRRKKCRYIFLDTIGTAQFTVQMYIDNQRYSRLDGSDIPLLELEFRGGDFGGFGAGDFGKSLGGGRPTADERLYAWRGVYKLAKLRMKGSVVAPLRIIAIGLLYMKGGYRR